MHSSRCPHLPERDLVDGKPVSDHEALETHPLA
jgi:hypothetical protein